MSRLIDDSITQALATARAALADTALAADLAAAQPSARAALREETTETWKFDSAPTNVIGLVVVDTGRQVARSVKIQNIAIRPMLALRNALGGVQSLMTLATGGALTKLLATGTVTITGGVLTLPLGALAFVMAAHFARRQEIAYDHGCVLALAWTVSDYVDGNYVAATADVMAALPAMVDFGVHDYNPAKARTAISRLESWQALDERGDVLILYEHIEVRR